MPASLQKQIQSGFTLVEILVVIAILSIIGVSLLPNLKTFNVDQNFRNTVSEMAQDIRKAQANSQSKIECPKVPTPAPTTLPVGTRLLPPRSTWWEFQSTGLTYNLIASCSDNTTLNLYSTDVQLIGVQNVSYGAKNPTDAKDDDPTGPPSLSCSNVEVLFDNDSNTIQFVSSDTGCKETINQYDRLFIILQKDSTKHTIKIEKGGAISVLFNYPK